jgi:hypothetical protein
MKIAFMGSSNVGKTTLIEEFLKQWPMFKRPAKTYRDLIREKKLKINKEATPESQKEILNALVDEAQFAAASDDKFIVFDRCVVDNMAYTLWHYAKETPGFTSEFIMDCKTIAAFALKHIDIIFYLPARQDIPVTKRENRETDPVFREEIDNIFESLVNSYEKGTRAFFPPEDCPAVIRLEGPLDMRLPQIKLYLKDDGSIFGEQDGSLISDLT